MRAPPRRRSRGRNPAWLGVALLLVVGIGACDPSTSLTRLSIFAFAREGLVEECCVCLTSQTTVAYAPSEACPEVPIDLYGEVDGGCPPGAPCETGIPETLAHKTPCLCGGLTPSACMAELNEGRDVEVVGRCLDNAGVCTDACSGVLAFEPPEP